VPEISYVFPDYPIAVHTPHLIMGEGFDPEHTEVWTWTPPGDERIGPGAPLMGILPLSDSLKVKAYHTCNSWAYSLNTLSYLCKPHIRDRIHVYIREFQAISPFAFSAPRFASFVEISKNKAYQPFKAFSLSVEKEVKRGE
jgi:hypothetical protein